MTILRYLWLLLLLAGLAGAEQEGDYARETRNLPEAELTPDRIPGLFVWLRSDVGVTTDETGAVTAWADQSGKGNGFAPLPNAAKSPMLTPNVVGGKPAVSIVDDQHRGPGLQSGKLAIDPAKGLTLFVLARVNAPMHIGYLFGYGPTHKTAGSLAMWAHGTVSYGRSLLYANTGAETAALEATSGNIVGKGFCLFAVVYDPATGTEALYQDGIPVGRAKRTEPLVPEQVLAVGMQVGGGWSVNGDILAALAYNAALSVREVRGVQQALAGEYGLAGGPVSALAPRLPFAYYPSVNKIEVAVELSPEMIAAAGDPTPTAVTVRILDAATGKQVATGNVPLDGQSRGQTVFDVPDFPDGEYAVEYVIGKHVERSPQTFKRLHFPFETTDYGDTHEIYPPFTPVRVSGNRVSVVGRTYTVNALGLLDSVVSLDRELLAGPMRLVAEDRAGKPVAWRAAAVEGRVTHPDEAVFQGSASSPAAQIWSKVTVEEDGCVQVALTLGATAAPTSIGRLWIEIPIKDAEAPLFHYLGDNGMRFNYGGKTPRGGRIEWYREPWDGWVPLRWRVAEPGPDDGVIWTSGDTHQHGNQHKWDHRPFCSQVWLGAEERGLAFLMESDEGFATDYKTPLQTIERRGDTIVLRVDLCQQPVDLIEQRTVRFGFMASPGKPMEKDFRTRPFASGVGPVSCWGGWQCASKYPAGRDWSIVDKIQEIRRRHEYTDADQEWFAAKYEEVKQTWPERKINGSADWLWLTTHFAKRAAERGASHSGIYFEEHATDPRIPEFQVFQDEWASAEFNRFQQRSANWGVFAPSYQDFVLYTANEWMGRGVSLYFDNTNPKRCYNYRWGPAYRSADGAVRYGISIFGQRRYYRRIYKLLSQWNAKPAEYPVDFTLHITNTQTLPFNTWATATLDLEQRAYTLDPEKYPPETEFTIKELTAGQLDKLTDRARQRYEGKVKKLKNAGFQLPWAPDYTRTVTFGRQVGVIPTALDFVSGHGRHQANDYSRAMLLRNWGVQRIHDIRTDGMWMASAALARDYEAIMDAFGYGDLEHVDHHNYWAEQPFVQVGDDRVKWQALRRRDGADPMGLLVLQSYERVESPTPTVAFPGAAAFLDIETRELIPVRGGVAAVTMPPNFSTRMFLVAADAAALAPLAGDGWTEDFALATPVGWEIAMRNIEGTRYLTVPPAFMPRADVPAKRSWRLPGGVRDVSISRRDDWDDMTADLDLSLRFRLAPLPDEVLGRLSHDDILHLQWRYVPEDRKAGIESRTLRATLRANPVPDGLQWVLVRVEAIVGKVRTPLTDEPLVLGPGAVDQWATLAIASRGTTVAVRFNDTAVAELPVPEAWPGTVLLTQGGLLASGRAPWLDLTDLTVQWKDAP